VCTENRPNDITVCDVALPDVAAALQEVGAVTYTHLEGQGTRIVATDTDTVDAFRSQLGAAIALHGGSLPVSG
jgi:hypothetical protein